MIGYPLAEALELSQTYNAARLLPAGEVDGYHQQIYCWTDAVRGNQTIGVLVVRFKIEHDDDQEKPHIVEIEPSQRFYPASLDEAEAMILAATKQDEARFTPIL